MSLSETDTHVAVVDDSREADRAGFSLVELLVVIGLLGLLFAFSAPALISNRTVDLSGASLQVSTLFEQARAQALAYGVPVRILVHEDRGQPGRYLRRVIVVRETETETGGTSWESVLHPALLPQGIYFDFSRPGTSTRTMSFAEGVAAPTNWRYYEIRGSGAPSGKERNVILGPGVFEEGDARPTFPNPDRVAGFRITDAARSVPYHSGSEIISPSF